VPLSSLRRAVASFLAAPPKSWALPLWGVRGNRAWAVLFVGVVVVLEYAIAGQIALIRGPALLPLTRVDLALPFLPWTFWVYLTVYFIYFCSAFIQKDRQLLGKFLTGYVIAYTLIGLFFVAVPTTFPRDQFAIPSHVDPLTRLLIDFSRATDLPTNCWPSMHVASCVLCTAPLYRRRPVWFAIFTVWSLFICVSTLTTKQHYAADLLPGALYGLGIHLLATRWLPFRAEQVE
jgi:membrane-associated phospholipid phosphatase